jgi:hypothetical protein
MKNLFIAAIALFSVTAVSAQKNAIEKHFSDFEQLDDFTKVNVTSKMFELALHVEGQTDEEKELIEAISNVEGLSVLAKDNAENSMALYKEAIKRPGSSFEELMTVDDKEAQVVFMIKESGGVIDELLVIYGTDDEFAIVDIWGEIDLKQVRKMTEAFTTYGMDYFDEKMIEAKAGINYYPNPVTEGQNGTLSIPDELKGCQMQIHDTNGRVLVSDQINDLQSDVSLDKLKAGTYVLSITKDNVKLYTQKVVVVK